MNSIPAIQKHIDQRAAASLEADIDAALDHLRAIAKENPNIDVPVMGHRFRLEAILENLPTPLKSSLSQKYVERETKKFINAVSEYETASTIAAAERTRREA